MDLEPDAIIDFLSHELYQLVQKYPENSELREVAVEWTAQLAALKDVIDDADVADAWAILKHDWAKLSQNVMTVEPREINNPHINAAGYYLNDFGPGAATKLKLMIRRQRHATHHFDNKWLGLFIIVGFAVLLFGGGYYNGYLNNGRCDSNQLGRIGNLYYRRYTHGVQCDPNELVIDEPTWLAVEKRANEQGLDWPLTGAVCVESVEKVPWHGYLVVGRDLDIVRNTDCSRRGTLELCWFGKHHDQQQDNDHNQKQDGDDEEIEDEHYQIVDDYEKDHHENRGVIIEEEEVEIDVDTSGDNPIINHILAEEKWEYVPEAGYDYADIIEEEL